MLKPLFAGVLKQWAYHFLFTCEAIAVWRLHFFCGSAEYTNR